MQEEEEEGGEVGSTSYLLVVSRPTLTRFKDKEGLKKIWEKGGGAPPVAHEPIP